MKYYLLAFKRIADFKGRSRRKEFWLFYAFNLGLFFIYTIIFILFFRKSGQILAILLIIHLLVILFISIPLSIRRLHDIGKSGFYMFIHLIPFLGTFAFFMMMITKGEEIKNKYGLNPKTTYTEIDDIGV